SCCFSVGIGVLAYATTTSVASPRIITETTAPITFQEGMYRRQPALSGSSDRLKRPLPPSSSQNPPDPEPPPRPPPGPPAPRPPGSPGPPRPPGPRPPAPRAPPGTPGPPGRAGRPPGPDRMADGAPARRRPPPPPPMRAGPPPRPPGLPPGRGPLPGEGEPDGPPRGAPAGVPETPGRGAPLRPSPCSGPYRLPLLTRPHQLGYGCASREYCAARTAGADGVRLLGLRPSGRVRSCPLAC